jgi:hypothetical protein
VPGGWRRPALLCSRCGVDKLRCIGAPAGVEGVEPSLPALETGGVTVRYTPMCSCETKAARRVSPASGFRLLMI